MMIRSPLWEARACLVLMKSPSSSQAGTRMLLCVNSSQWMRPLRCRKAATQSCSGEVRLQGPRPASVVRRCVESGHVAGLARPSSGTGDGGAECGAVLGWRCGNGGGCPSVRVCGEWGVTALLGGADRVALRVTVSSLCAAGQLAVGACAWARLSVLCSHATLPAPCLGRFLSGRQPDSRVLLGAERGGRRCQDPKAGQGNGRAEGSWPRLPHPWPAQEEHGGGPRSAAAGAAGAGR